mmetsp:Transcript_84073/g.153495  ORF Transcript_84073/g.153495 Transcript_84073/m.153495 type:complete len:304 (-) Transcript_84073:785-1696(-)
MNLYRQLLQAATLHHFSFCRFLAAAFEGLTSESAYDSAQSQFQSAFASAPSAPPGLAVETCLAFFFAGCDSGHDSASPPFFFLVDCATEEDPSASPHQSSSQDSAFFFVFGFGAAEASAFDQDSSHHSASSTAVFFFFFFVVTSSSPQLQPSSKAFFSSFLFLRRSSRSFSDNSRSIALSKCLPIDSPASKALCTVPFFAPPCFSVNSNHSFQCGSLQSVVALPTTTSPRRARVIITFSLRQSLRKPTDPRELQRTALKMMSSFSRPWKLSTEAISRSRLLDACSAPAMPSKKTFRKVRTWPL